MKFWGKIVLASSIMVSGVALADWVGRWYCPSCSFDPGLANGETYEFIWTEVNQLVNSWVDSDGNENTVTICNGSKCANYKYIKLSGQWQYTGYYYSDWYPSGGSYNPGGSSGSGGGGSGGGGGGVVVVGPISDPDEDTEDK